jgi:Class III cytochrome C family
MPRPVILGLSVVLLVVLAFSFVRPQLMVAPGAVVPAHAAFAQDCFACHAPLRGAAADRCLSCHATDRIGLFTSKGRPLPRRKAVFHQKLIEAECMACHTDHAGPRLTGHHLAQFDHALLRPQARTACAGCHMPPSDPLHRKLGGANCSQCHSATSWRPATFAHDRFFRLDRDHNVTCTTCHLGNNFKRTTCYGCHEHKPARIIALHREEGVRGNIERCARCHKGPDGEPGEDDGEGDD